MADLQPVTSSGTSVISQAAKLCVTNQSNSNFVSRFSNMREIDFLTTWLAFAIWRVIHGALWTFMMVMFLGCALCWKLLSSRTASLHLEPPPEKGSSESFSPPLSSNFIEVCPCLSSETRVYTLTPFKKMLRWVLFSPSLPLKLYPSWKYVLFNTFNLCKIKEII